MSLQDDLYSQVAAISPPSPSGGNSKSSKSFLDSRKKGSLPTSEGLPGARHSAASLGDLVEVKKKGKDKACSVS